MCDPLYLHDSVKNLAPQGVCAYDWGTSSERLLGGKKRRARQPPKLQGGRAAGIIARESPLHA
jgi:hypothetical protein